MTQETDRIGTEAAQTTPLQTEALRAAPPRTGSAQETDTIQKTDAVHTGRVRQGLPALLPDLRAFARFLARDPALADDLVQEAMLRALRAEAQWMPGTSLRAWLFHILRNVFLEQMRRRGTERRALERMPEPDGTVVPQDGHGEVTDLGRALQSLPLPQREALILVGAHGLSNEEAAAVCGVPVGTIKARVSRARAALARNFPHRTS